MFHNIPPKIKERMQFLEKLSEKQKLEEVLSFDRLRQIPPETGKFLSLLSALSPPGKMIEIGTSGGYSGLWLSLACIETGRTLTTFEISPLKVKLATDTFQQAGVDNVTTIVQGDARDYLNDYKEVSFCFLDCEKEYYMDCYEIVVPNMVKSGLLIADNAISHKMTLTPMIEHALQDIRVDAFVIPIGNGELVCRKQ